jgi:alpha-glucoside transport system substrate-binding protein
MGVHRNSGGPATRRWREGAGAWSLRLAVSLLVVLAAWGCSVPSGTEIGGTVQVLGSWEGPEQDAFMTMVAPFEQRTGVRIEYTSSRDLQGVLERGIAAGDPPDVAGLPGPGFLARFARSGGLKDLTGIIDVATYKAETIPSFIDLGTIDGMLVGVFIKATVKGLLWYDPMSWTMGAPHSWEDLVHATRMAATSSTKPWCVGLESGASSGWPGTDWIEDFLLRQSGPGAYDRWIAGDLAWTSPEVRGAFVSFGQVIADGAVNGGASGALTTHFSVAGRTLFDRPPGCFFLHQGSFMASFLADDPAHPAATFDFMPFPDIDPRWAGSLVGGGDLFGLVRDTPQAREFIRYLVTPEAQTIWVKHGGALSGNLRVSSYPDEISAREAKLLTSASHFRFDASDAMPEELNAAFWQAVLDFTRDQDRLDAILEHLDSVAATAYGG